MIKIAFFDVDGTLLRLGHKELSANTAAALRQLHQNGIILCMATGRSYTGVPHFDGIDFDVLLTFNGSLIGFLKMISLPLVTNEPLKVSRTNIR